MFNFFKKTVEEPIVNSDGSLFKVPLTSILKIEDHPNADRLSVATVYGFQVVTQKNKFKVGDLVIYFPIDCVLNQKTEDQLFGVDAKIKLHNHRIRQIRIRGYISQGMITSPDEFKGLIEMFKPEEDLARVLDVKKYEPPVKQENKPSTRKFRNKPGDNQNFRKYNGVTNLKWCPNRFDGEEVVIQSKVHGSHARAMWAPYNVNTLIKKIKRMFGLTPKYEFCVGSNNVEVSNKAAYSGFYSEDIYTKAMKKYNVAEKMKYGEAVHFEIYGEGIQANYHYGTKEHKLIMFDVRILNADGTHTWLNPEECEKYAKERGFDFVPVLYKGMFDQEILNKLTTGPDPMWPAHPREGVVVKSRFKYDIDQTKQGLKSINPVYLDDKTNTDEH